MQLFWWFDWSVRWVCLPYGFQFPFSRWSLFLVCSSWWDNLMLSCKRLVERSSFLWLSLLMEELLWAIPLNIAACWWSVCSSVCLYACGDGMLCSLWTRVSACGYLVLSISVPCLRIVCGSVTKVLKAGSLFYTDHNVIVFVFLREKTMFWQIWCQLLAYLLAIYADCIYLMNTTVLVLDDNWTDEFWLLWYVVGNGLFDTIGIGRFTRIGILWLNSFICYFKQNRILWTIMVLLLRAWVSTFWIHQWILNSV